MAVSANRQHREHDLAETDDMSDSIERKRLGGERIGSKAFDT
jgi:hypothetical protein